MKKQHIKIALPPVRVERKPAKSIGLTPEQNKQFNLHCSIAYQLLFLADAQLAEAESVLRVAGKWELDLKKKVGDAQRVLARVTDYIEKSIDSDKNGGEFYNTLNFFDKVLNQLLRSKVDKDDEIKILSYLKNNYHEDIH